MAVTGMYLPGSLSNQYVANKRTESGDFVYDQAENQIGLQEQAALQSLKNDYSITIANAYSSYLSSQRGILGSAMGQGYKEAYLENQRQALMDDISNANLSLANYRQQVTEGANTMRDQLTSQFQTEVTYADRLTRSLDDYLLYVKSLSKAEDQTGYLTNEQLAMADESTELLYDALFNAQPKGSINNETGELSGYFDPDGNAGMTYIDWLYKNTDSESDYARWLFGQGGYNNLREQLLSQSKTAVDQYQVKQEELKQDKINAEYSHPEAKKFGQLGMNDSVTYNHYDINGKTYTEKLGAGGLYASVKDQDNITEYFTDLLDKAPEPGDVIKYNGIYYVYHTGKDKWTKGDAKSSWIELEETELPTYGGGTGRGR